ncbi:MAG TPA: GspH/FimT family pseudopilin [Steroidobacteraceae bacterium]|nr:GspH/FimT family pseudopilin [Steroidobacteraceae bacterium]
MRLPTTTDVFRPSQQRGFTLLELVITMAIAAILLVIAIPSFQYITTSNRMSGEINDLLGAMQLAKAEAIKEGQTATICASTDQATCSGASTWNTGWIIFAGTGNPTPSDPVIHVHGQFYGSDSLQANGNTSAVSFNREGFAFGLPGAGVTFTLHDPTGSSTYTRCLTATVVGALATTMYNGGSCQ